MNTALRIAVESDDFAWIELTRVVDPGTPISRIRVSSLGEAAASTARSNRPVFVDIDVHLADTVKTAFAEYGEAHPGWEPGARIGTIVHPGTVATLVGLLRDIAATGVADGVTLRGLDAPTLRDLVSNEIAPEIVRATADV